MALGLIVFVAVLGRVAPPVSPASSPGPIVAAAAAASGAPLAPVATPSLRADWPAAFRPRPAATLPKREYGTDGLMGRLAFSDLYDEGAAWRVDRLDGLGNYRTDPYQR